MIISKLTRADPKKLVRKYPSRICRWLYQFPLVGVLSHWLFQSLLYVDWTERLFKLSLEALLIGLLFPLLHFWLPELASFLAAIFTAHTANFLFNSHPWAVLRLYGGIHSSFESFEQYMHALAQRARREPSIQALIAYGSLARQEWDPTSDLDVRLVRKPGLINGLRACVFLLSERIRALYSRFPLDAYVLDSELRLFKLREMEKGIDLLQSIT